MDNPPPANVVFCVSGAVSLSTSIPGAVRSWTKIRSRYSVHINIIVNRFGPRVPAGLSMHLMYIKKNGLVEQISVTHVLTNQNTFRIHRKKMIENFKSFCSSIVSFNDEEWTAMEKCLAVKTLKKNEHFLKSGEVCTEMGFITRGSTRLYFAINGADVTKDFCFENSFTGSFASFQTRRPARFSVVAMEDTQLVTLKFESLEQLCAKHHCWSNLIRIVLGHFAIRKEEREISFLLNTAEQRYTDLVDSNPGILQRVSLKYIASYLGITPETVSRIRNKIAGN